MVSLESIIVVILAIIIIVYINSNKSRKDIKGIKKIVKSIIAEYPEVKFIDCEIKMNKTKDNVDIYAHFEKEENPVDRKQYIDIVNKIKDIIETTMDIDKNNIDIIIMKDFS